MGGTIDFDRISIINLLAEVNRNYRERSYAILPIDAGAFRAYAHSLHLLKARTNYGDFRTYFEHFGIEVQWPVGFAGWHYCQLSPAWRIDAKLMPKDEYGSEEAIFTKHGVVQFSIIAFSQGDGRIIGLNDRYLY